MNYIYNAYYKSKKFKTIRYDPGIFKHKWNFKHFFFSKLKEVSKKINEIIFCYGTNSSTNEDFLKHIFLRFYRK